MLTYGKVFMGATNNIQSVDHAIDIVEFLYSIGREASISEIGKGTGMFGSTVYRQLSTLKDRGYVYQNPQNSKYWLGLRFYTIGNMLRRNLPMSDIVGEEAEEVARKYGQNIFVAVPDYSSELYAQQIIIYCKYYSQVIIGKEIEVGSVLFSHGSATGKCMMAYYTDDLIRKYRKSSLVKLTEKTITDWDLLMAELGSIRTRGYSLDSDEEEEGKTCIAVPIFDGAGNIAASVSLSGQTKTMFEVPINAIVRDLREIADQVGKKM